MHICILVGSVRISGGTYVIFQHAHFLQESGYDVTLAIQEPFDSLTAKWHDLAANLTLIPIEESYSKQYDIVIATWWKTALELHKYNNAKLGYFVQSIESRFYDAQEKPLREYVDSTYDLDVNYCTEAIWIQKHLKDNHNQQASLVPNGVRKDIYFPDHEAKNKGPIRVLIEGPFNVGFKNTGLAIACAKKAGANEIWLLTGSVIDSALPYVDKIFSNVPILETAKIYQKCDVLIKLSTVEGMFGPPLEMFHCGGTAVVLDVTGHEEYMRNDVNGLVISTREYGEIVKRVSSLINDQVQVKSLSESALLTAEKWPDWDKSSELFKEWVDGMAEMVLTSDELHQKILLSERTYISKENERLKENSNAKIKTACFKIVNKIKGSLKHRVIYLAAIWEILTPFKKIK